MGAKGPRRLRDVATGGFGLLFALFLLIGQQLDYARMSPVPSAPTPLPALSESPSATPVAPTPTPFATSGPALRPTATPGLVVASPTPTPRAFARPVRLRIPSIGVDAPIVPVGLTADGQLEAPKEAQQVGWYEKGARPGEPGNALLDGHVDWLRSIAVFYFLGKVEPGQEVILTTAAGEEVRLFVQWKALYEADKAPMAQVFGATLEPVVTIITCGGQFDRSSQSYTHRWVVRASAIADPDAAAPAAR